MSAAALVGRWFFPSPGASAKQLADVPRAALQQATERLNAARAGGRTTREVPCRVRLSHRCSTKPPVVSEGMLEGNIQHENDNQHCHEDPRRGCLNNSVPRQHLV